MKKQPLYLTADKIAVLKAIIECLDVHNHIRKVATLVERNLTEKGIKRSGVFTIKVVALLVKMGIMIELDRSKLPRESGFSVEYLFDNSVFRKFQIVRVSSDTKAGRETGIQEEVMPPHPAIIKEESVIDVGEALEIFSKGISEISSLHSRREELMNELAIVEARLSEIKASYDAIGVFLTETEMGRAILKMLSVV